MSVSSPCEICHQRDVEHTCDRCAQLVCHRHYDPDTGFCVECVADVGGRDDTRPGERMPDGVDTYRS